MPLVPAYCDACGSVFSSGIDLENSTHVRFHDIGALCPKCGANGKIIDGLYSTLGNTLHIMGTSRQSAESLQNLLQILKDAKKDYKSPEQIRDAIKTQAPELQTLADWIPKTRAEAYALVAIIVTVIGMIIKSQSALTEPQINALIEKAVAAQTFSPTSGNRHERRAQGKRAKHKQLRPKRR